MTASKTSIAIIAVIKQIGRSAICGTPPSRYGSRGRIVGIKGRKIQNADTTNVPPFAGLMLTSSPSMFALGATYRLMSTCSPPWRHMLAATRIALTIVDLKPTILIMEKGGGRL
jgi:hypothetical protein